MKEVKLYIVIATLLIPVSGYSAPPGTYSYENNKFSYINSNINIGTGDNCPSQNISSYRAPENPQMLILNFRNSTTNTIRCSFNFSIDVSTKDQLDEIIFDTELRVSGDATLSRSSHVYGSSGISRSAKNNFVNENSTYTDFTATDVLSFSKNPQPCGKDETIKVGITAQATYLKTALKKQTIRIVTKPCSVFENFRR
ncbi:hypothetical protein [Thiothrix unzii]|uniref:Uncharacterized protein n=1 Tax=Thiothrix unzii TaxID=111769 RepID=A0A975IH11_9GAMM|nr:hypothetical protein [Thiothrix unzii]QTR53691.1 hypothetical protein J9260_00955 [Thiothrix unzii]